MAVASTSAKASWPAPTAAMNDSKIWRPPAMSRPAIISNPPSGANTWIEPRKRLTRPRTAISAIEMRDGATVCISRRRLQRLNQQLAGKSGFAVDAELGDVRRHRDLDEGFGGRILDERDRIPQPFDLADDE